VGVRRVDWKHDLLPDEEQREPMLRRELTRVSVVGLRAVSLICIGGTSLMLVFTSILKALGYLSEVWIETDLAIIAVGLAATPFWRKPSLQKHARAAGCLVGLFIGWIFIVTAGVSSQPGMDQAVPYNLLLVMLVAMAALPLRPLQTIPGVRARERGGPGEIVRCERYTAVSCLALGSRTHFRRIDRRRLSPESLRFPGTSATVTSSGEPRACREQRRPGETGGGNEPRSQFAPRDPP